MNLPSEKKLSRLAPNIFKYGIPRQLIREYDQKKVEGYKDECDRCGSRRLWKFGFEDKTYATVILQSGFEDVIVKVRRYRCVDCGHVMICDEGLFYPRMNYGRGIVDACLFLVSSNTYNAVERIMLEHGIQIDVDTVRRYAIIFGKKAAEYAPLKGVDGEPANLGTNLVKVIFGKDDVGELGEQREEGDGHDRRRSKKGNGEGKKKEKEKDADREMKKTDAVVDETFPSVKGSKGAHVENNRVRKSIGEKTERFGKSFTLASSYLHNLHFFASMICTLAPFSSILAEALVQPLKGCAYILSDGSRCYNGLVDERCAWHFMKNFFNKRDPGLDRMKRHRMLPAIISEHMRYVYSIAKDEYLRHLRERYPQFVSKDEFLGATTTNAMEGGNWRIKYELRVPYLVPESIFARSMLIELRDSLYTFRHGHPEESFAHRNGVFSYSRVLVGPCGQIDGEGPPPIPGLLLSAVN